MAITKQNVKTYAGDDVIINVSITDETAAPLDITGATFAYVIAGDEGGTAIVTKTVGAGIVVTSALTGLVSIHVSHTDTSGLLGAYWHQIVMTDTGGNLSTITTGEIVFRSRAA